MENPFCITGIIPEPYFCDRGKETKWFVSTLENKAHILLSSPRRMGKTQLIRHVYEQPSIKNNYYTFYTDIYPTTSTTCSTTHLPIWILTRSLMSRTSIRR